MICAVNQLLSSIKWQEIVTSTLQFVLKRDLFRVSIRDLFRLVIFFYGFLLRMSPLFAPLLRESHYQRILSSRET